MIFILFFSISFGCLAVIFLILCAIPLWDSTTDHSPFGKELSRSSQEDARFSVICTFHLASSLFRTQPQLTHLPVKSSTLPLRKMPVLQGVSPWHKNITLSSVIPLWDSATAHLPSGKELLPSSVDEWCFSELIVV